MLWSELLCSWVFFFLRFLVFEFLLILYFTLRNMGPVTLAFDILIIPQKLRIAKNKSFMQKMSARLITIHPANLATFERKIIFWGAQTWACLGACGAQTRYDVIGYFTPIFIFSSLSIFYVKIATSEWEGGGLHILSSDRDFFWKWGPPYPPSLKFKILVYDPICMEIDV